MRFEIRLPFKVLFVVSFLLLGVVEYSNGNNTAVFAATKDSVIRFDNSKIQYIGRVDKESTEATALYWPGTQVVLKFKGTGLRVRMEDDSINSDKNRNYFYVFVDGKRKEEKLKIEKGVHEYTLFEHLDFGVHEVRLYKLNSMHPGYPRGGVKLYDFTILGDKKKLLSPPGLPKRKIEFYGNSITCGVSNSYDGEKKDDFGSQYENNYYSYGSIVARHFEAQFSCIAKSGVGLLKGTTLPTMPNIYDLVAPFGNDKKWDFSKFRPQVVVVNLLQNDATLTPDEFSETEQKAYMHFIKELRQKYPNSFIICALGSMNAVTKEKWRDIVSTSVKELGDSKVFLYFFDYIGHAGHPRVEEHQKMADGLIKFIENNKEIRW